MASTRPAQDVVNAGDPFGQREGVRIIAALAALLASVLLATGGLIWREHSRAQPRHDVPPAATALR